MKLEYKNNHFILDCGLLDRDLPKKAGFVYNRKRKLWVTPFSYIAKKLAPLADKEVSGTIDLGFEREKKNILDSESLYADIRVPKPDNGMRFFPFQSAGIDFILKRPSTLLADPMGIGKTIQAIGAMNCHLPNQQVLIICPATAKSHWLTELKLWYVHLSSKDVAYGKNFPWSDIVIINYDILQRHHDKLRARIWDILIIDEFQYLKNPESLRTREVCGHRGHAPLMAKKRIALTGTYIVNRPIEAFPLLRYLSPYGFPNKLDFARRYCDMQKGVYGFDMSGASNIAELQHLLRSTIMIRRSKALVLPQLPKKRRQIVELDGDGKSHKVIKKSQEIMSNLLGFLGMKSIAEASTEEYEGLLARVSEGGGASFEDMSTIRKELGLAILPMAIEHLRKSIEESGKVVCFCWHTEVAKKLKEAFGDQSVMIIGATNVKKRGDIVKSFQEDKNIKLFIGNIKAAGTVITLTASSHTVFVELDWVPGNITQAEDRSDRIGSVNSLLVQHLVLAGSMSVTMAKACVRKQKILDEAMESQHVDAELVAMLS